MRIVSLPVIDFILTDFTNLSLLLNWLSTCLNIMNVYLAHSSVDKMTINKYRSVSLLPVFSGVFQNNYVRTILFFFREEEYV